jgi:hypothetical protein
MNAVARGDQPFTYDEEQSVFNEVWKLLGAAFEKGDVFKAKTEEGRNIGPFSPSLYEMITYGMAQHREEAKILDPQQLRQKNRYLYSGCQKPELNRWGLELSPEVSQSSRFCG